MGKRCRWNVPIVFGLLALAQSADAGSCRDAVFSVDGALPFLAEDVGPLSIRFEGHEVALDPICPAQRPRLRRTPRGLSANAHWRDCGGIAKGVRLRLQTTRDCSRARGIIRTAEPRSRLRFHATREGGVPDRRRSGLREGFQSTLRLHEGCGDAFLFAHNHRDTLAIFFSAGQLAERAHAAGQPTTFSLDLASEQAALWVQRGKNVSHSACNDALSLRTRVGREYRAISGHVTVIVTPSGPPTPWGEFPAEATLLIEDALLAPEGAPNGEPVHLDRFEMKAQIGRVMG